MQRRLKAERRDGRGVTTLLPGRAGLSSFLRATSLTTFCLPLTVSETQHPPLFLLSRISILLLSKDSCDFLYLKKRASVGGINLHCPMTILFPLDRPAAMNTSSSCYHWMSPQHCLNSRPTCQLPSDSPWNLVCHGDPTVALPIPLQLLSQRLLLTTGFRVLFSLLVLPGTCGTSHDLFTNLSFVFLRNALSSFPTMH